MVIFAKHTSRGGPWELLCPARTFPGRFAPVRARHKRFQGQIRANAAATADAAGGGAAAVKPIPLRRANDPADVAAMAVFLASPGARNITGQCYNVDGGLVTS